MRHPALFSALAVASLLLSGCHHRRHDDSPPVFADRLTSIEIEVYDPNTGYVWENVAVRILEVEHEWSNCICENPVRNDFFYTDEFGVVFFSADYLGHADLGFLIDRFGRAVLSPDLFEDEANVLIEVSAPGFDPVYERINLSWEDPRVYVQVPF